MLKQICIVISAALALSGCQPQRGAGFTAATPVYANGVNTSVDAEGQVLALINAERAQAGLPSLAYNGLLTRAARGHAQDLARNGYFSHTGRDGSSSADRARRVGYDFCIVGENISMGHTSIQTAMQGWMASKGHRDNILNRKFTEMGIGIADGAHYVTVFGSRC
jgi:uncharacterized protein YkwD